MLSSSLQENLKWISISRSIYAETIYQRNFNLYTGWGILSLHSLPRRLPWIHYFMEWHIINVTDQVRFCRIWSGFIEYEWDFTLTTVKVATEYLSFQNQLSLPRYAVLKQQKRWILLYLRCSLKIFYYNKQNTDYATVMMTTSFPSKSKKITSSLF